MTSKYLVAIVLLAVLFNAAGALAANSPPEALISNESLTPVTSDAINARCRDPDMYGGNSSWKCKPLVWYYFSEQPCSNVKEPLYTTNIPKITSTFYPWATITARCEPGNTVYPYNYLCVWVEDYEGLSAWKQSKQLQIDCSAAPAQIISPTTLVPALKQKDGSVDVVFNVSEPSPKSYSVTISDPAGMVLCSGSKNIPAPGNYTFSCSWTNAADSQYNVEVKVTDILNNQTTAIEAAAVIINTPDPPVCISGSKIMMVGEPSVPRNDAINLNNVCYDPDGTNPAFSLGSNDCASLVDGVFLNANGSIDIGRPLKNLDIVGWSESCTVNFTASDGTFNTQSQFEIEVFKKGDLELKIRYPSTANGGTVSDITNLDVSMINVQPGQTECFDIIIENNRTPLDTGKPLDLAFVVDASGSMQLEINTVHNTIPAIADAITARCLLSGLPTDPSDPLTCFRLGATVMEGAEYNTATPLPNDVIPISPWEMDLTSDIDSVKALIGKTLASGGSEPWADYVINIIDGSVGTVYRNGGWSNMFAMSWRPEATKLIIVISDASNNNQTIGSVQINRTLNTDIAAHSVPANITVSFLGTTSDCDPAGCPMAEMIAAAAMTGGEALPYNQSADDISNKIIALITSVITKDDVVVLQSSGPDWIDWGAYGGGTISVDRGDTDEIQNVCITVPSDATDGGDFDIVVKDPGAPPTDPPIDGIQINLSLPGATILDAVISAQTTANEGDTIFFSGASSTCILPDGMPCTIAEWKWNFGDGTPEVTGENVSHTFVDDGDYGVTLTVRDSSTPANEGTENLVINVSNVAPTVSIEGIDETVVGEITSLTLTYSDPEISSGPWVVERDFGDGSVIPNSNYNVNTLVQNMFHIWTVAGTYTVTATVTDKDGGVGTASKTMIVLGTVKDVFVMKEFLTLRNGQNSNVFYTGDTSMPVKVLIENRYMDPFTGTGAVVPGRVIVSIIDPDSGSAVLSQQTVVSYFATGETWVDVPAFDISGLQKKNYSAVAVISVPPTSQVKENVLSNNSKQKIIYVMKQQKTPVPEAQAVIVPIAVLGVLLILWRRKK